MNTIASWGELSKIYPPDRLFAKPTQLAPYESDALTSYQVNPLDVVLAEIQDEVIRTVQLCHACELPYRTTRYRSTIR